MNDWFLYYGGSSIYEMVSMGDSKGCDIYTDFFCDYVHFDRIWMDCFLRKRSILIK